MACRRDLQISSPGRLGRGSTGAQTHPDAYGVLPAPRWLTPAGSPDPGHVAIKDRVNAIALAPTEDFRRDSEVFGVGLRNPEARDLIQAAFKRGLQTRDAEMDLAALLGGSAPS